MQNRLSLIQSIITLITYSHVTIMSCQLKFYGFYTPCLCMLYPPFTIIYNWQLLPSVTNLYCLQLW